MSTHSVSSRRKSMRMLFYSASGDPPPEKRWRFLFNKSEISASPSAGRFRRTSRLATRSLAQPIRAALATARSCA